MTKFVLNGKLTKFDVPSEMPLLWVLRDIANLTGTKYSCGKGLCGACTVIIDGKAMRSCVTPVSTAAGKIVTTIEGVSEHGTHPVQQAWIEAQAPQCGYCQPGMIMAAIALIESQKKLNRKAVYDHVTNLCRCGTYPRIVQAILSASTYYKQMHPLGGKNVIEDAAPKLTKSEIAKKVESLDKGTPIEALRGRKRR